MSKKIAWMRISSWAREAKALGPERLGPVQNLRNVPLF